MRTFSLALGLVVVGASVASGQEALYPTTAIIGGVQAQNYSFGAAAPTQYSRQFAFPLAVIIPAGQRFTLDIGTQYATTSVKDSAGTKRTFSGLTDTQVRASYVFGRDAVVATLMVNLPTGKRDSISKFASASATSSNFLTFPVNSYYNGTSVTGGLAVAGQLSGWNVGLAGSLRVNAKYTPFKDTPANSFDYKPGVEGRARLGVDRLVSSSRFQAGFTFSTFGDDKFTGLGGGTTNGVYSPGNRYIGEVGLTSPAGSGTFTVYAWDFFRAAAADTTTGISSNKENVLAGGVSGSFPLSPKVRLEPVVEAKLWSPNNGSGHLIGGGASLRFDLSPHLSFAPGGRFDFGTLKQASTSYHVSAWGLTGVFRYDL